MRSLIHQHPYVGFTRSLTWTSRDVHLPTPPSLTCGFSWENSHGWFSGKVGVLGDSPYDKEKIPPDEGFWGMCNVNLNRERLTILRKNHMGPQSLGSIFSCPALSVFNPQYLEIKEKKKRLSFLPHKTCIYISTDTVSLLHSANSPSPSSSTSTQTDHLIRKCTGRCKPRKDICRASGCSSRTAYSGRGRCRVAARGGRPWCTCPQERWCHRTPFSSRSWEASAGRGTTWATTSGSSFTSTLPSTSSLFPGTSPSLTPSACTTSWSRTPTSSKSEIYEVRPSPFIFVILREVWSLHHSYQDNYTDHEMDLISG